MHRPTAAQSLDAMGCRSRERSGGSFRSFELIRRQRGCHVRLVGPRVVVAAPEDWLASALAASQSFLEFLRKSSSQRSVFDL